MKKCSNEINLEAVSQHQKLSEEFIRDFQDKADWKKSTSHQQLYEKLLIEFKNKIEWYMITEKPIPEPMEVV